MSVQRATPSDAAQVAPAAARLGTVEIPAQLWSLSAAPGGTAWLADLPRLAAELVDSWSLELGEPFPGGCASFVCPARRPDGTDAVLKVQYPHLDCRDEALALRQWDGDGAVRLLDHDPDRHALLLERCNPGGPLADLGHEAALDVLIGLLPRLWVPVAVDAPYIRLADMARSWVAHLADLWEAAGRPFERRLIDAACSLVDDLAGTQGEAVLVNQDLHGDNVLAAEREHWLAIDPKPLAGERAFGLSSIVRSSEFGHSSADVHRRLDRLSAELGVDRERARSWSIAQAVAWSIDRGEVFQANVDSARWLLEGPRPTKQRGGAATTETC